MLTALRNAQVGPGPYLTKAHFEQRQCNPPPWTATWHQSQVLALPQHLDAQPAAGPALWDQHEAALAVNLAKQTLMALGYSVPLQSGVRDR